MDINVIGLILLALFFGLYFFTTQKIYRSKYFFWITVLGGCVAILSFLLLSHKYAETKIPFATFLTLYYLLLLVLIKMTYKKLNNHFISKKWVDNSFSHKDFTYVTHAYEGIGNDIWDNRRAFKPSRLDYILSYGLFFGPMLLLLLTLKINGS